MFLLVLSLAIAIPLGISLVDSRRESTNQGDSESRRNADPSPFTSGRDVDMSELTRGLRSPDTGNAQRPSAAPSRDRDPIARFVRMRLHSATDKEVELAVALIRNGDAERYPKTRVLSGWGAGAVPVTIKTMPGEDYFVKFVLSDRVIATGYIRGGESLRFEVPSGGYDVRYAAGTQWFGPALDFGPDASYARCDKTMWFALDYEYTIELIPRVNGNLETRTIGPESF